MSKVQQSAVDRLPEHIREKLQEMLRDPAFTQTEARRRINAILEDEGRPERMSYSSLNRYAVRMRKIGARIQQSREVSKMWIGTLGAEPQGEVGKLLNEMVRNLAFDATVAMADGETPVEPKMLKDMAIAIERLERAASENTKREEEIRKRALKEAASIAGTSAKKGGLSDAAADEIRKKILGVVKR